MITTEQVKALRDETGISVMQCKDALEAAGGNISKAKNILKEKGAAVSEKKSARSLGAGVVRAYVHNTDDIGAMVELLCETDFVAKNDEFKKLAYDIAMHLAAVPAETKKELLAAEFIKDPARTIEDLLKEAVHKFGEKTQIGEFSRLSIQGR